MSKSFSPSRTLNQRHFSYGTISSTTTETPSSTTRESLLGPLTTTFTLPSQCRVTLVNADSSEDTPSNIFYGQSCSPEDDFACSPPATSAASDGQLARFFATGGFYSPGIACPAGYAVACKVTQTTPASTFPSSDSGAAWRKAVIKGPWQFQYPMEVHETGIGCCPIGYSCTVDGTRLPLDSSSSFWKYWQACERTATLPLTVSNCFDSTTTVLDNIGPGDAFVNITAPMFQLVYRATDLITSTSSHSSASNTSISTMYKIPSNSSQAPTISSRTSISPTNTAEIKNHTNTSSKAKIAIVVSVLGTIMLVAIGIFLLLRRKVLKNRANEDPNRRHGFGVVQKAELEQPDGMASVLVEIAHPDLRELDSSPVPAELRGAIRRVDSGVSSPRSRATWAHPIARPPKHTYH